MGTGGSYPGGEIRPLTSIWYRS